MVISEKPGQLEKEAREQGARGKEKRNWGRVRFAGEKLSPFPPAPSLFVEARLAYFPQLSRYILFISGIKRL
jgi:hypothetical protein